MKLAGRWTGFDRAPVWERSDGLRVHYSGLCRPVGARQAESISRQELRLCELMQGGRRRGLMLWAERNHPMEPMWP